MSQTLITDSEDQPTPDERTADAFLHSLARWMKGGIIVIVILLVTGILQAFMVSHRQGRIIGAQSAVTMQSFQISRKLDEILKADGQHAEQIKDLKHEVEKLWKNMNDVQEKLAKLEARQKSGG